MGTALPHPGQQEKGGGSTRRPERAVSRTAPELARRCSAMPDPGHTRLADASARSGTTHAHGCGMGMGVVRPLSRQLPPLVPPWLTAILRKACASTTKRGSSASLWWRSSCRSSGRRVEAQQRWDQHSVASEQGILQCRHPGGQALPQNVWANCWQACSGNSSPP
jgi:hypothetical protein